MSHPGNEPLLAEWARLGQILATFEHKDAAFRSIERITTYCVWLGLIRGLTASRSTEQATAKRRHWAQVEVRQAQATF